MGKFTIRENGYDIKEVNAFLDQVIDQVERMVKDIKKKDDYIFLIISRNYNLYELI